MCVCKRENKSEFIVISLKKYAITIIDMNSRLVSDETQILGKMDHQQVTNLFLRNKKQCETFFHAQINRDISTT